MLSTPLLFSLSFSQVISYCKCCADRSVWLLGYDKAWPYAGEIDIIEGVQEATQK